jgi:hypothetical protein
MDEVRELVTVEQAARMIRVAAVALPVAGLVVGGLAGAFRRCLGRGLAVGLSCGMAGPAVWALWVAHGGIVARYGLDSVRGLLVGLGLFAGVGAALGVGIGYVAGRLRPGGG